MVVTTLYKRLPNDISASLWSCFILLLFVPKNWRLLFLSEGHSVRICFIVTGVSSPQFFTYWGVFF